MKGCRGLGSVGLCGISSDVEFMLVLVVFIVRNLVFRIFDFNIFKFEFLKIKFSILK